MDFAYITNAGTQAGNEDSFALSENEKGSLFVVADGLGGHGKGEVASAIASSAIKEYFEKSGADARSFLPEAFSEAQSRVLDGQKALNSPFDMKTTCTALLIADGICRICHIGDTRAYVFHRNKVKTRTLDHSVPQMLVASGELKEKHIRAHPDRNRLLRVLGVGWEAPQYELSKDIPLSECQAFLLCTDGFWELCGEKTMCAFLKRSANASGWLSLMEDEVKKNGKGTNMDNYTAVAVIC